MAAYYNENNPAMAAWLRELIREWVIADGEVDDRDIEDVSADDVRGFVQCHFFAGLGGWSAALRLAGWPDDRPVWTGSCPCQKFSGAARGRVVAADVWPAWFRLIAAVSPCCLFGEQVPHAKEWFAGVCDDLEAVGYEVGAAVLPAVGVGADHIRPRIYFAGHTDSHGQSGVRVDAEVDRVSRRRSESRSVVSKNGLSRDLVALSGFGNAIVPAVAAAFIEAYCDATS